jgi:hypothetical protein
MLPESMYEAQYNIGLSSFMDGGKYKSARLAIRRSKYKGRNSEGKVMM